MSAAESVKVCFRFRNKTHQVEQAVKFLDDYQVSVFSEEMRDRGEKKREYRFDRVWQGDSKQQDVYNTMGRPLLKNIFDGYNSTLFVYGQTGSGKTYTMFGPDGGKMNNEAEGVVPRLMRELFQVIEEQQGRKADTKYTVMISIVDVYLEKVRDLQNKEVLKKKSDAGNLKVRMDRKAGVTISYPDDRRHLATEIEATSYSQVLELINKAIKLRKKTGAQAKTNMNDCSSRSHLVVQCKLKEESPDGIKESKLLLCDLAGSEKVRNTGAVGKQLKQAQNINYGLSVLGAVLNALTDATKVKRRQSGRGTIPFTESNLTRILQDSLGGNCKTALICTGRPDDMFYGETLSTLRFGNNAKKIKNNVIKNETLTVAQYQKRHRIFEQQVADLTENIKREQVVKQRAMTQLKVFEDVLVKEHGEDIEELRRKHKLVDLDEFEKQTLKNDSSGDSADGFYSGGLLADIAEEQPMSAFGGGCRHASGPCSCGLAGKVATLMVQNDELHDELASSRAEVRAHDHEIDRLAGQLEDYRIVEDEWEQKDAELANLKGEAWKYAQKAKELEERVKLLELEKSTASRQVMPAIEAFRTELHELGAVALDDSRTVMKIINNGDSNMHQGLVERISNQSAEVHRLQSSLDQARKQIDAFHSLKQHMQSVNKKSQMHILEAWTVYKFEKNKFDSESKKMQEQLDRQEAHIVELKAQHEGNLHRRQFGAEAKWRSMTSNRPKRKKSRRRRNGSPNRSAEVAKSAIDKLRNIKMSIETKNLDGANENMMSPCA